jgi:hypothetical protein
MWEAWERVTRRMALPTRAAARAPGVLRRATTGLVAVQARQSSVAVPAAAWQPAALAQQPLRGASSTCQLSATISAWVSVTGLEKPLQLRMYWGSFRGTKRMASPSPLP